MKLGSFQAVIFDMDGVIVNSEPLHERAFRDVFQEIGFGETHGVDFPAYYGKSDLILWQDFVAKHKPPYSVEDLLARKQKRFIEFLRADEPVFAGLPDLVAQLAVRFPLAVASGSPHPVIEEVLALQQLCRFFSAVVSASDVPHGKPAPDIFLHAAALLGVPPARCVVIEDSTAGIEAARAAAMPVIAIANTFPIEKLDRATRVVKTYEEIGALLTE
jgi:HAD superfamily hydrolase (TIGR01509 family)